MGVKLDYCQPLRVFTSDHLIRVRHHIYDGSLQRAVGVVAVMLDSSAYQVRFVAVFGLAQTCMSPLGGGRRSSCKG